MDEEGDRGEISCLAFIAKPWSVAQSRQTY